MLAGIENLVKPHDIRNGVILGAIESMHKYFDNVGRKVLPETVLGGVNSPVEVLSSREILDWICAARELVQGVGHWFPSFDAREPSVYHEFQPDRRPTYDQGCNTDAAYLPRRGRGLE